MVTYIINLLYSFLLGSVFHPFRLVDMSTDAMHRTALPGQLLNGAS